ncbi:ribokinase [uncultured Oscillibacter sp.]|uniref:ribokinase n=1 Tax=uncultured Oscillibacter sp. TaxID=876091 RepID=UPI00216FEE0D|nr:ribokinase [uncultured Oscillibacter sp.]MCI9011270.1 ribokinase [Oscillibacter sp.]
MRVLSFGSLNIDYVYEVPRFVGGGETLPALSLRRFSGGKGLNQSVALARAGLEVRHAGAVGRDGLFLLEELRAAGADTRYVEVLEDVSTGHAVIQRTPAGENCILLYGGANRRITREHIDRVLSDFGPGDALVLQNEISELPYLAEQAKKRDMIVALNPSPMEEGLLSLLPSAGYLILNEIEASQLLRGLGKPVPEAGEALAEALPSSATIVLTLGPQGSLCAAGGRLIRQAAVPVRPVDTTAAGDAYTGFFLAGALSGRGVEWAMEYASAAAAIAVTRPGAAPSIPSREEVLAEMGG